MLFPADTDEPARPVLWRVLSKYSMLKIVLLTYHIACRKMIIIFFFLVE